MVKRTAISSMKDVARLAGVSLGTVSNTLNRPEQVGEETQERVKAAIAKLGWVPNETARQLRAGKSRSIGLIIMDIGNPFITDLTRGVEQVATAAGYTVMLSNSDGDPVRERAHLAALLQQRVRGVVLAPIGLDWDDSLVRSGIPLVVADRAVTTSIACTVAVDDFEGGRVAAAHLIEQGHTRVAFVGGPTVQQVRDRREGAQRAMLMVTRRAELQHIATDELTIGAGRRAAESIGAMPAYRRPTGVLCANDLIAIGLLQGLVHHGLRVPEDVAVVGYDDIQFAAAAAVPLSSVRQPREQLGRTAAEQLLAEIAAAEGDTPHIHRHVRFTPELIVRASSANDQRPGTDATSETMAAAG